MSREHDTSYHLYRVFTFRKAPKLYLKKGPLDHEFALSPEVYRGRTA